MIKKKVFVTGAYGLLGTILCKKLDTEGYKVFRHGKAQSRQENFSLDNYSAVKKRLDKIKPNFIINLVALTDVNECENNLSKAIKLNVKFLTNFNKYELEKKYKSKFIHISTDQVYSGKGPHIEEKVNPINNYGLTKILGEIAISDCNPLILRTNFIGKSKNQKRSSLTDWFVKNVIEKKKTLLYTNVYFNPLEINYLSAIILKIMTTKKTGIYNLGAKKGISKEKLLSQIGKFLNLDLKKCKKIKFIRQKKIAKRPNDMIMNCSKFEKTFQLKLPSIQDQISRICQDYKKEFIYDN
jgi:dTDP-4-dehydrorhamnose reductase